MDFKQDWSSSGNLEFVSDSGEPKVWSADGILDFAGEWDATGKLEFVVGSAPVATVIDITGVSYNLPPVASASFALVLELTAESGQAAAIASANFATILDIAAGCEMARPAAAGDVTLDINVDRDPKAAVSSVVDCAIALAAHVDSKFADSPKLAAKQLVTLADADFLANRVSAVHEDLPPLSLVNRAPVADGIKLQAGIEHLRDRMADADNRLNAAHGDAVNLAASPVASRYRYPPRGDCGVANAWALAEQMAAKLDTGFEMGTSVIHNRSSYFEDAIDPTGIRPVVPVVPPVDEPAVIPELDFKALWENTGELAFLRIELDALIVMNEIEIYHVASDSIKTAIHPVNATLDFDIDSFVWSFNGQLLGKDNLALLTNRASFEINVNGHQLLFTLREFSRAGSFANDAYSFTCVTNSQWLGQPYATLHNGTVDNPIGAWQLVAEKFATESFTLNRVLTPEWILQTDSFSYLNKSAIEIALQVAQASGAILQPDKLNNVIHVQPRYKTSPWNWAALSDEQCDHVINADYITTESSSDNTTPQVNSVLISGETHGVITETVKSGTAGDVRANDVLSPLSQDHNVNAELARNIMSDSGEQEVLGLNVPLLPPDSAFGLLLPGEIVRVVYPDKTITGLCIGNSVPIQSITDVSQSVKLELNNGYS